MRRLIMWNMVTLDGFFEGSRSWDIGWHELGWGEDLERLSIEQTSAADMRRAPSRRAAFCCATNPRQPLLTGPPDRSNVSIPPSLVRLKGGATA